MCTYIFWECTFVATHLWMCLIWLWSGHVWLLQYWGERSARGLNISSPRSKCSTENPAILEIIHHVTVGGSQARVHLRERGAQILWWTRSIRFYYICANMHGVRLRTQEPPYTHLHTHPWKAWIFQRFLQSRLFPQTIETFISLLTWLWFTYKKRQRLLPPSGLEYLHMQRRWIVRFRGHVILNKTWKK